MNSKKMNSKKNINSKKIYIKIVKKNYINIYIKIYIK